MSNRICFALTYLLFVLQWLLKYSAIVSQLSKIFWHQLRHHCQTLSPPLFCGSAKVHAFLFLPKYFSVISCQISLPITEPSGLKINLFIEELTRFLFAGCKDTVTSIPHQTLRPILFTFVSHSSSPFSLSFRELPLVSQAGRKDKNVSIPAKYFYGFKTCKHFKIASFHPQIPTHSRFPSPVKIF